MVFAISSCCLSKANAWDPLPCGKKDKVKSTDLKGDNSKEENLKKKQNNKDEKG